MSKVKRNRCEFCGWLLRLDGKHFGNDGITCAKIQSLRETQAVLVKALEEACDREWNPFEPDNQSHNYKRWKAAINLAEASK